MAETAVGSLLQTCGSLLLKEGLLAWGLHKEIREIKLAFESIQSFLKDADMGQHTEQRLRTWVEQVRNLAYEVEDIIDEYTYFMAKHQKQGLKGVIYDTISFPKKLFYQHRIAGKVQDLKSSLKVIKENSISYPRSDGVTSNEARKQLRMNGESSANLPEDDLVGIESNKYSLISWLTNKDHRRLTYSVFGMGGVGKSTLVGKVYHSSEVQNHFNCCAWITVTKSFDTEKILRDMIKDFMGSSNPKDYERMDYKDLVKTLINHLEHKRYVLILDDVWDIDAWNRINVAIPNNKEGSRVMITTRDKDLAYYVAELKIHVFELQPLDGDEAWTLFCQKAFRNNPHRSCPVELESLARNIVKKCDGLPLMIAATGSLMSLKAQDMAVWKYVEANFRRTLIDDRLVESAKNVLLLSYYELPTHLKQCFLHLCTFPEDYIFFDAYIIRIWVAEGFIEETVGPTLEDVAMDYINELVGRCMIQYVGRNFTLKCYRVHDVMREIGVSIARDQNFSINSNERQETKDTRNARRLLLQVDREGNLPQLDTSNLRSYIVYGSSTNVIESFNPAFKLLRVLDLQGAPLQEVPKSFGKLFNLQYLNLCNSKIRELPKSMKRLRNLRTLYITQTKVKKLPNWIEKLEKMRHLNMSYEGDDGTFGVEAPIGLCKLTSLEALEYVEGNKELWKNIGNLTQLKWLAIESVKADDGADLCTSLQKMESLLELLINHGKEHGPLELEELSSPPPLLKFLVLNGKLERLPRWIGSFKSLVQLWLWNSNLSANPLSPLQDLPKLEELKLVGTYDGNQLCFRAPFFSELKKLHLGEFNKLDMIEIEDGTMHQLEYMHLYSCQELKTLPMGIEYLKKLKVLLFNNMPEEFTNRLGPGGTKEDKSKIQHIEIIKGDYSETFL